ncbi:GatB/YqeY domain-containing protein [Candidatus Parcubacteria bacterium]|nr:GatB/YqeY domain-containing protein [Candidatus Parcubacteria bacterium]
MSLQTDIKEAIKQALVARDQVKLTTLRGLSAAFTNELVAKKRKPDEELSDEDVLAVISRAVKQRKDSIEQFEKGRRQDLADAEKVELAILEGYLPEQMSREEVEAFVAKKKLDLGITDPTQKNQFMGLIMKDLKGKADGTVVREMVDLTFK